MKSQTPTKSNLLTPATLALLTLTCVTKPASAIEIPHSVLNGIYYPTGSQQFFSQGRQQFEKEIDILLKKRLSFPEKLLKINPTPTSQDQQNNLNHTAAPPTDSPTSAPDFW